MIIRTISQLPKVQQNTFLPDDSLFEVSVSRVSNSGQDYISKAVRYKQLSDQLYSTIQNNIVNTFSLKDASNKNINVKTLNNNANSMLSGTCTFTGTKTFNGQVLLKHSSNYTFNNASDSNDYCAATVKTIKNALNGTSARIGKTNNIQPVKFLFNNTGTNETKLAYLEINNVKNTPLPYSGTLVIYGWLADTGVIDTAQCWVALEGQMQDNSWKILQLQPWILGSRHSNMQYVGFNVPVAQGMKLRVEVGFELNYQSSSYQLRDNTLVDNTAVQLATNSGPAFIGSLYY